MDLSEISRQEEEAFELFKQNYIQQRPPPRFKAAVGLDWRFWAVLITSVSALLLATLRTMDIFYEAALLSGNPYLAIAEAVAVVLAIEGGIVVWSAIRASKQDTGNQNTKLGVGIFFAVLISMFAGLGQSLHLIDNIDPTLLRYFQYTLTVIIGIGASLVAYIGGDVLGGEIALAGERRKNAGRDYDELKAEYQERLLSSWARSLERKIARGELVEEANVRSSTTTERTNKRTHLKNYGSNEVRQEIMDYIDSTVLKEGYLPGPSEIAREVGTAKSYAHQVIGEWKDTNGQ